MGSAMQKHVYAHMRTVTAQISLHIHAVQSGPLLSANRIIGYYRMYEWKAKGPEDTYFAHAHDDLNLHNLHMFEGTFLLTHLSLTYHKRDTGKQCRPRSDAAESGIWSGSTLFALNT